MGLPKARQIDGHHRMVAYPDRNRCVLAANPVGVAPVRVRNEPGHVTGPGLPQDSKLFPGQGREQGFDLVHAGGDEQQPFLYRPLFQRKHAQHRSVVERIAAEPPHGFGRAGDHAAPAQALCR